MLEGMGFSKWYDFEESIKKPDHKNPGVYLIANFKKRPTMIRQKLPKNVINIGETTYRLDNRLRAFKRAALKLSLIHI